ncbi:MAG: AsmA family protein, partial [Bacteroidia bacterium]|nr:AsmA family protein [Bacteroidia bacterium]
TSLIAQLSTEEQSIIKIPVNALISGTFKNPNIKTDFKAAVSNLGKQIADNQKQKLITKGKDEVTNALTQLLNKNLPKDSTKVSTKVDSVKVINNDKVKEAAKDALKNLLGGKKKKKDTVQ